MVVNGAREFVGSDYRAALNAIREAAARPSSLAIHFGSAQATERRVQASLGVERSDLETGEAELFLAVVEADLSVTVSAGENGGRTLRHTGVVRSLSSVGTLKRGDTSLTRALAAELNPSWIRGKLSLVVFAQNPGTRRIAGVAQLSLNGL
jgi:hypothetical protein